MALTVGTLTLYREKSAFFDGAHPGPDLEEYARLIICANRVTWMLTNGPIKERLVVRGHNVPCTIRLTALIIDAFKTNPTALSTSNKTDWPQLFSDATSDYDKNYNPNLWYSVYSNGVKLAQSTEIDPAIDILEKEAQGAEIDEAFLKRMSTVITDRRSIRLRHDSIAAIILNQNSDGVRCAVLDRRKGKDAGFSFKIQNPPGKRVRVSSVLHMAADIFELQNLYSIVERVEKILSGEIPNTALPISLEQLGDLQTRNAQLTELVKSFNETFDISYRPAPPSYLPKM